MELAICSAVISLSFLIACPLAFAESQHDVSIKVFTSTDDQFWTNSVMIEGLHEVKDRFPAADFLLAIERGATTNVKP